MTSTNRFFPKGYSKNSCRAVTIACGAMFALAVAQPAYAVMPVGPAADGFDLAAMAGSKVTAGAPACIACYAGERKSPVGDALPVGSHRSENPSGDRPQEGDVVTMRVPASERDEVDAEMRVRRQVRRLEIAFQALNLADAAQTIYFTQSGRMAEGNPLLGRDPSPARVILVKASSGVLHYLAAKTLTRRDPRMARVFEYVTLAVQGGVVAWNFSAAF